MLHHIDKEKPHLHLLSTHIYVRVCKCVLLIKRYKLHLNYGIKAAKEIVLF